jgi:hypothetical protein
MVRGGLFLCGGDFLRSLTVFQFLLYLLWRIYIVCDSAAADIQIGIADC